MIDVAPHAAEGLLVERLPEQIDPELPFLSLFSGIAGMDTGLVAAGGSVTEMCESWEPARRVLASRYPEVPLAGDVREFNPTSDYRLLAAGFPCVDLSHAGRQAGIFGASSGLVTEVFRIAATARPEWIVLENVPNLLRLGRGAGIRFIIENLEKLGYSWAYRVLDSRAFGVAQRRNRVIVLASMTPGAAAQALLGDDSRGVATFHEPSDARASGFYWTEGRRGVGLVRDAVPTLKGGSTLGLPSAPAVWRPGAPLGERIVLPAVEDAEILQGFERGWTAIADLAGEPSARWKLVGNAVTVPLAHWIGTRVIDADRGRLGGVAVSGVVSDLRRPWPDAAFGSAVEPVHVVPASRWPVQLKGLPLEDALDLDGLRPLSHRATRGFLSRVEESGVKIDEALLDDLEGHLAETRPELTLHIALAGEEPAKGKSIRQSLATFESRLRRALGDKSLRYRLQERPEKALRWRADVVIRHAKVAVVLRDCFWDSCPTHASWPAARVERWESKRTKNSERAVNMEKDLVGMGWAVLPVWEHEDHVEAAKRIDDLVGRRVQHSREVSVSGAIDA